MRYWKMHNLVSESEVSITYIETELQRGHREITVQDDSFTASNVWSNTMGLPLAEGIVDFDPIEEYPTVTEILRDEFEAVWQQHLAQRRHIWDKTVATHVVGSKVEGVILRFFPQGIIVWLGDDVLGIANYVQCSESSDPQFMYPNHCVTATVRGYDEAYQWIVLDEPQAHAETKAH